VAGRSQRAADAKGIKGIKLEPLKRTRTSSGADYSTLSVVLADRLATITVRGPDAPPPASADAMVEQGAQFWPLRLARELDNAILDLRLNELDTAAIIFKSSGDPEQVIAYDRFFDAHRDHLLAAAVRALWRPVVHA